MARPYPFKEPPRRLCVDKGSRFYDFVACQNVMVIFEDEVQSDVYEYDLDKQWILTYKRGVDGGYIRGGFGKVFLKVRRHGKLEVTWK